MTMDAVDAIINIANTKLLNADLRYCLMSNDKLPHKIDGSMAKSNSNEDFVDLMTICDCQNLSEYKSLGISIWASKVCAIDLDHCLTKQNDISSASDIAKEIVDMFKDVAYIEYSFSGMGLRILFRQKDIPDYVTKFYVKNSKYGLEYYQPSGSARYVSVTGNVIYDNDINSSIDFSDRILAFLNKYMRKPVIKAMTKAENESRSFDELMKEVKKLYMTDAVFQDSWFMKAPGAGKNESEQDYKLLSMIYENITTDKEMVKQIFEQSNYFKSKDRQHLHKWSYNDHRYFNYQFEHIVGTHQ